MRRIPAYVWLNGKVVQSTRAQVSVFDRGLLYGDGLFETVRAYRGRVFALKEHLERMGHSARALGYRLPRLDWEKGLRRLLAANGLLATDASVRITVTRGTAPPGLLPPPRPSPTVFAFALPVPPNLARDQRRGIAAACVPFSRLRALAAHKLLDYMPAITARRLAAQAKAQEAIYTDRGQILEATTANVFCVRGGALFTPPLDGALPGVTRQVVVELARAAGIAVHEQPLLVDEAESADEIFLTSSVVEVLPVVRLNGRTVGTGSPGPITRQLQRDYRQFVDQAPRG
jgi:D-amino acid aminotransferase